MNNETVYPVHVEKECPYKHACLGFPRVIMTENGGKNCTELYQCPLAVSVNWKPKTDI